MISDFVDFQTALILIINIIIFFHKIVLINLQNVIYSEIQFLQRSPCTIYWFC